MTFLIPQRFPVITYRFPQWLWTPGPCFLLILLLGCSKSSPEATLVFQENSIDLELVESDQPIFGSFKFRVWDKSPVKIVYASTTCCGPNLITPNLVGQTLAPGSEHELRMYIRLSRSGESTVIAGELRTDPPSASKINVQLKGKLVAVPSVHPTPVVLRSILGAAPSGSVSVRRLRTIEIDALELDGSRTSFGAFAVKNVKSYSHPIGSPDNIPPRMMDALDFELTSTNQNGIGTEESEILLWWKGFSTPTKVKILTDVQHPVLLQNTRLYCGTIVRGRDWNYTVPVTATEEVLDGISVASNLDMVSVYFDRQRRCLNVAVCAEAEKCVVGPFLAAVTLSFGQDIPAIELPVTGVIK